MALAGVAWGTYTLRGRGAGDPARATAKNFLLAAPLAGLALVAVPGPLELDVPGALYASASGALTSGLGYVLWYAALRGHTRLSAAVVQLTVPILAATGGVAFAGEELTTRYVGATFLVLGGVTVSLNPWRARRG